MEITNMTREQCVATELAAKNEVANELARKHYEVEDGLTQVFRVTDNVEISDTATLDIIRSEPIKFLEINKNTIPSGVMPLYFGPSPANGILYPSVVVEVTPEEFEKIKTEELKLPEGWEIGKMTPIPKGTNKGKE
jgi:hypothetical protein